MRRLPPGSHGIPADVVARNQRERLIAAMAEVCAERGYAESSVAAVAKRAGVSSVTFYKQFADKQDCMLSAHRQLLGRLLEEVDRVLEGARGEEAQAAIGPVLALFAADVPSARSRGAWRPATSAPKRQSPTPSGCALPACSP
jgi:AcrR family transcriptional regulator